MDTLKLISFWIVFTIASILALPVTSAYFLLVRASEVSDSAKEIVDRVDDLIFKIL